MHINKRDYYLLWMDVRKTCEAIRRGVDVTHLMLIYVASLTIHVFHRRIEKITWKNACKSTQWRHSDNDVFIMPMCIHITIQAMRKKANHHHHILQPSYLLPRKRETVFFFKKRILMIHTTHAFHVDLQFHIIKLWLEFL